MVIMRSKATEKQTPQVPGVVSGGRRFNGKKLALWVTIVVLVLGLGAAAYFLWGSKYLGQFGQNGTDGTDSGRKLGSERIDTTIKATDTYIARGDTKAAVEVLDAAINRTDSKEEKASLYVKKAQVTAATDATGAVDAAKEATEVAPNFENLSYLAELYERQGDKVNALKYYQESLKYYDQIPYKEDGSQIDKSYYENKVKELQS